MQSTVHRHRVSFSGPPIWQEALCGSFVFLEKMGSQVMSRRAPQTRYEIFPTLFAVKWHDSPNIASQMGFQSLCLTEDLSNMVRSAGTETTRGWQRNGCMARA